jgi:DNA modification methylase
MLEINKIYNMDCLEGMKQLESLLALLEILST